MLMAGCGGEALESTTSGGTGGAGGDGGNGGAPCIPGDDENPCTSDLCEAGMTVHVPEPAGTPCSDAGAVCDGMGNCIEPPDTTCRGVTGLPGAPAIGAGDYIEGIATADFDGDSLPDLVAVADDLRVSFGNGDGTFTQEISVTGFFGSAVAAADLNGDGAPDIAVKGLGNKMLVFPGNGDKTFAPPIESPTSFPPVSFAAADMNGDGHIDLVGPRSNGVTVLYGNGDGTFASETQTPSATTLSALALADLDSDGAPDVAVTDTDLGAVSVLINQGDGTFASPIEYDVGSNPRGITAIDVTGDGALDLAVAMSGAVAVLENQGNGTFAPKVDYAFNGNAWDPSPLIAADITGDGAPDLVLGHKDSVRVFANQGDGTFSPMGPALAGETPAALVAIDANGDGALDIASAHADSNTVGILLGTGNGDFPARDAYPPPNSGSLTSVASADVTGDGAPDLAIAIGTLGPTSIWVVPNKGDGTFDAGTTYTISTATGTSADLISVTAVDLNGDGPLDLVAADGVNDKLSVLFNQGDGTFKPAGDHSKGSSLTSVVPGDFNGDGSPDLVLGGVPVTLVWNKGDGSFGIQTDLVASSKWLSAADFNEDGALDLATAAGVLLNKGDGSFGPIIAYPGGVGLGRLSTADMNGDGKIDLISHPGTGPLGVLMGNGDGTFAPPATYVTPVLVNALRTADLNGDAMPDVILTYTVQDIDFGTDALTVLFNDGTGSLLPPTLYSSFEQSDVAAADLNGDGRIDLATVGNGVEVLLNTCL